MAVVPRGIASFFVIVEKKKHVRCEIFKNKIAENQYQVPGIGKLRGMLQCYATAVVGIAPFQPQPLHLFSLNHCN